MEAEPAFKTLCFLKRFRCGEKKVDFGSESCIIVKAHCCWILCECGCLGILQKSQPAWWFVPWGFAHTYYIQQRQR